MDVGMYTSVSGMHTAEVQQQLLASNLANSSTPGYKGDDITASSFQLTLQSLLQPGSGTFTDGHKFDLSQGGMAQTGQPLDLALDCDGFFALSGQNGTIYTRSGRFSRDASGELRSPDGLAVQGSDGNPIIASGANVRVGQDGTVTSDGQSVGKIAVVTLDPTTLTRAGTATFSTTGAATPATASTHVLSGMLENANVDISSVMTSMMELLRAFEASRQGLTMQNETIGAAVTQVGATH
jgi:flagellar basal-body rod protein FlgF